MLGLFPQVWTLSAWVTPKSALETWKVACGQEGKGTLGFLGLPLLGWILRSVETCGEGRMACDGAWVCRGPQRQGLCEQLCHRSHAGRCCFSVS